MNLGILLLSGWPNHAAKRAAEAFDLVRARRATVLCAAFGLVLLVSRAIEFRHLNCRWDTDAYGSVVWTLLGFHTAHLLTDWLDTLVLGALLYTGPIEGKRYVDVSKNAMYWYFVLLSWIPIYAVIYWVPRLARRCVHAARGLRAAPSPGRRPGRREAYRRPAIALPLPRLAGRVDGPAVAARGRGHRTPAVVRAALRRLSPAVLAVPVTAVAHAPAAAAARFAGPGAWVVGCLLLSAFGDAFGLRRLWRRAGRGRGVRPGRLACFIAGWLALGGALSPPLDALADRAFSAHMLQHEILMLVVAPLLVLARPLAVWSWAFPRAVRGRFAGVVHHPAWQGPWRTITAPLGAWTLHALALWGWHLPAFFDAALASTNVHTAQHASFLATALVFWWSVLRPGERKRRATALAALFTTMMHSTALGALLTLSSGVWYAGYAGRPGVSGLSALADQQLGVS